MYIADEVSKSVVFIGGVEEGEFRPRGIGFLVLAYQRRIPDVAFPYLVTAAHVLENMQRRGIAIHCCLNRRDGTTTVTPLASKKWFVHPEEPETTDVAVLPFWVDLDVLDHEYLPLFNRTEQLPRVGGFNILSLGARVFAIGLFKPGKGSERNIPIVRIGNIAAMPPDLVHTRHAGELDAYLIELRSTAGLSGSPVFVNPPHERGLRTAEEGLAEHIFVGLLHGHLNAPDLGERRATDGDVPPAFDRDTGIGVVVPVWKIIETLYQPDSLAQMRSLSSSRSREVEAREQGVIPLPRRRHLG